MVEVSVADRPRIALVSHLVTKYSHGARGLTILDLACRTGSFSHALATQGHRVTGIEGRKDNLDQAPLHPNIQYELANVKDLPESPQFDVTLCLGLLYHLTAQEALELLRKLTKVTRDFVILDTHVSTSDQEVVVENRTYFGHTFPEVEGDWSSIGNDASWWFTEDSLKKLLSVAGWHATNVESPEGDPSDRRWFVLFQEGVA